MQTIPSSIKLEVEKSLLTHGCKLFVQNYLLYFYDDIDNGKIKLVIAPTDSAIQRLERAANKTIEQIVHVEVGLEILANHISEENPNPNGEVAYQAVNGYPIRNQLTNNLKVIPNGTIRYMDPKLGGTTRLHLMIVDNIIDPRNKLGALRNEVVYLNTNQPNPYDMLTNDALRLIGLELPLKDLVNPCSVSRKFNIAVCASDRFWFQRLQQDYPASKKLPGKSFKKTYKYQPARLYVRSDDGSIKLTLVEAFSKRVVTSVALGTDHTLVIANGQVYSWGDNQSGQLGLGPGAISNSSTAPTLLFDLSDKLVTKIAAGFKFSAAIVDNQLYTWGSNRFGQLGLSDNKDRNYPTLVQFFQGMVVTKMVCGSMHMLALADGHVYAWGNNQYGQLGLGEANSGINSIPVLINGLVDLNVSKLACGLYFSAVLADGKLYTWGLNGFSQLGLGFIEQSVHQPTLVDTLMDVWITKIACGENHMAVLANGQVWTWGNDGSSGNSSTPRLAKFSSKSLPNKNVTRLACGSGYTLAVENDNLFGWGNNHDYRQTAFQQNPFGNQVQGNPFGNQTIFASPFANQAQEMLTSVVVASIPKGFFVSKLRANGPDSALIGLLPAPTPQGLVPGPMAAMLGHLVPPPAGGAAMPMVMH